jgi:hypothetical protein
VGTSHKTLERLVLTESFVFSQLAVKGLSHESTCLFSFLFFPFFLSATFANCTDFVLLKLTSVGATINFESNIIKSSN